ncbi:hypothetical protein ABT369_09520 [Dactylosporangium sp. NPDC000244]|uniref:hypothetical protein n=1 Tax=Dactylosporangium sp. NPDC000244 TaxID=3154365 RepID=UPI00332B7D32
MPLLSNVTVSPDDAVATRVTVLADSGVSGVGVNVIVWLVPSMTNGLRVARPARPTVLAALCARPSVAGRPEGAALVAVVVFGDAVAVRPLALGDAVALRPLALGDAVAVRPLALGRGDGFRLPCVPVPSAALPALPGALPALPGALPALSAALAVPIGAAAAAVGPIPTPPSVTRSSARPVLAPRT